MITSKKIFTIFLLTIAVLLAVLLPYNQLKYLPLKQ
nr:MAG TPA: Carbonic anhydrase [Caudoviricetes sp.]